MQQFSQNRDVNIVLNKAQKDFKEIREKYEGCLQEQTIPDELLVEVKDCIANIRSALDYSWCKVPNTGKKAHFPMANSQEDFQNKV